MNKITFFCPCYNHKNYVLDFLNSLLKQTNPNWELFIFDDCSSDKTAQLIQSVKDQRIHLIQNEYNRGMAYAVSQGILLAKTDIVSFVASDDMLYPEYVETMLKTFNENPDISACYTPLKHMDEQGNLLESITPLPVLKTESQIFADMFLNENLLPSPGMAFKKSVIKPFLPLDIGMIQYTDWQMHFFLLYQHKIKLLEKPLVLYRVSPKSACARSLGSITRENIETLKLMDTVAELIGTDKKAFETYFGQYPLIKENKIDQKTIPFWLGRLALTSRNPEKQEWGLQKIMNYIATDQNVVLLHKLYGFSFKDYMKYANLIVREDEASQKLIKKIKKYKKFRTITYILILVIIFLIGLLLWQ